MKGKAGGEEKRKGEKRGRGIKKGRWRGRLYICLSLGGLEDFRLSAATASWFPWTPGLTWCTACTPLLRVFGSAKSGPEKRVITKGVFSLEKSLETLKSLNSLQSLENGRNLLSLPQSGGSLETLESLNSLESPENGLFWKDPFSKRPLFPNPTKTDPVRFKWGFGERRLKDKFAFLEAYHNPTPKRRKLLEKRPF